MHSSVGELSLPPALAPAPCLLPPLPLSLLIFPILLNKKYLSFLWPLTALKPLSHVLFLPNKNPVRRAEISNSQLIDEVQKHSVTQPRALER